MDKVIYEKKEIALLGREIFEKWKQQYQITVNDYIVVLADDNPDLNKQVYENLEYLQKRKYANRVFLVTPPNYWNQENQKSIILYLGKKEIEAVVQYYKLVPFFSNVIIVSLQMPFASKGLIGEKGITITDFIRDGVFY